MPNEGPVLHPGDAWTTRTTVAVRAGDPLEVADSGTVRRAAAGSLAFVGVAAADTPAGGLLTVLLGSQIIEGIAGGDIDPGDMITAGDDGTVIGSGTLVPRVRVYPRAAYVTVNAWDPAMDRDVRVFPNEARVNVAAPPPAIVTDSDVTAFPVTAETVALAAAPAVTPPPSATDRVVFPDAARVSVTAPDPRMQDRAVFPLPAAAGAAAVRPVVQAVTPGRTEVLPDPARVAVSAPQPAAVASIAAQAYPGTPARAAVTGLVTVGPAPEPPPEPRPDPAHPFVAAPEPRVVVDQRADVYPDTPSTRAITGQAAIQAQSTPPLALPPAARLAAVAQRVATTAVAAPPPTVTGNNPSDNIAFRGGTILTVTGTGFIDVLSVTIEGWRECTGTVVDSPTRLTTHAAPAGAAGQWYPLSVTTPHGTGTRQGAVRYAAPLTQEARSGGRALRADSAQVVGIALTAATAGGTVLWIVRRPRYPWPPRTPPAPLIYGPMTHARYTGEHEHPHDHGGGLVHDHPHGHDDTSHHGHPHPGQQPAPWDHEPMTGTHSHEHDHGLGGAHDHEHTHRGDARHNRGPRHRHDGTW